MAQAEQKIARRALFAAALSLPIIATTAAAAHPVLDEPLIALRRQREAILAEIEAVAIDDHYEANVERLSDLHDAVGARMIDFPICSAADARAKLSVVADLYHSPMHADGHDRVLFDQVIAWLDAASVFA